MVSSPVVTGFYHEPTGSVAYIVEDPATRHAAIIDPVLDYDEKAGRLSAETADEMLKSVAERGLQIDWILDTHPHADHLSATAYLKDKLGSPTAIGENIVDVQRAWKTIYNDPALPTDGKQWDRLLRTGDRIQIGSIEGSVMLSPGHTPASSTYIFGNAAFIHDTLFQPDGGTARADFPGGSAAALYDSIMAILNLPDDTRLFTGHDYRPKDRPAQWESTVSEQRRGNIHFKDKPTREQYVALRNERDRTLPMPRLILHAFQFNLRGGRLPDPENNGRSYLKIPIGAL